MSVMERGSSSRTEDDDDEKDKDVVIPTPKRTTIFSRGFMAEKDEPADRKEQKVARIIDSIFKEKPETIADEDKEAEPAEDVVEDGTEETVVEQVVPEFIKPESLETPETITHHDWEEGEIDEEGEINLQGPLQQKITPEVPAASNEEDEPEPAPPEVAPEPIETSSPVSVEENVDEEVDPPKPLVSSGSGGEAPPPDDSSTAPEDEPEPNPVHTSTPSYSSGGGGYSVPTNYNRFTTTPTAEDNKAREAELSDAEYRGRKAGTRKGLGAGLVAGYLFGRHGKKAQAKDFEKTLKSKDADIRSLEDEQFVASERMKALRTTQETMRSALVERANEPLPSPLEAPVPRPETDEPFIASLIAASRPETMHNKVEASRVESKPVNTPERRTSPELPPEEQEITEEMYRPVDGRRVETSSWHRIEVDAKTGRPVETPEVEYGEEFKHETQREILHRKIDENDQAAIQLGTMATTASAQDSNQSPVVAGSSPVPISQKLPTSPTAKSTPATKKPQPSLGDPIMWAAAVALIVILYILASILF